jgi:glycosyltransferase involved in cell wall biosynthesis
MLISVVIPVFNEQDTVRTLVERVNAVPIDKEIIIVDVCSTVGTSAVYWPN